VFDGARGRSVPEDFRLIYEARTARGSGSRAPVTEVLVDAHTAAVLSRQPEAILEPAPPPPSSAFNSVPRHLLPPVVRGSATPRASSIEIGTGLSHFSGPVWLKTQLENGVYKLCNPELGIGAPTCVYAGTNAAGIPAHQHYERPDNQWGDGQALPPGVDPMSVTGETAGVDALWGAMWSWEMLRILGFTQGPREDGGPIEIEVHADVTGLPGCAPWSTGGSVHFPSSCPGWGPWETPDSVGHAVGHVAYRWRTLSVPRVTRDEAGATVEATGDILGEMSEFYMRGFDVLAPAMIPNHGGDFIVGGEFGERSLRNFFKPSLHGGLDRVPPDTAPGDLRGSPHRLAGVLERAFYFMSRGARPYVPGDPASELYGSPLTPDGFPGLGNDFATRLWVDSMPFFTRGWFVDVRDAILVTVYGNYGFGPEYETVEHAFAAVGVGNPTDRNGPTIAVTAVQVLNERKVAVDITVTDALTGVRAVILAATGRPAVELAAGTTHLEFPVGHGPGELRGFSVFHVLAYDRAGNKSQHAAEVTVDADGPAVALAETTGPERTLMRRYSATATDPTDVDRLELRVDQRYAGTRYEPPYDFAVNFGAGAPYGSGPHLVEARAYDVWGNYGRASATITTDTASGPCSIPLIITPEFPALTMRVRHDDTSGGTALFHAYIDGQLIWTGEAPYESGTHVATTLVTSTAARGQHRAELRCTDKWGNISFAYPFTFVAQSRPTVTLTARADYDDIVADYTATDDFGLDKLRVRLDGSDHETVDWPDGALQQSGTLRIPDLSAGFHKVCAYSVDIHNYTSEQACQDVLTTSPPPTPTPTPTSTPRPPSDVTFDEREPNYDFGYNGWLANDVPSNATVIRGAITNASDGSDSFRIPVRSDQTIYVAGSDSGNACAADFDIKYINQDRVPWAVDSGTFGDSRGSEASATGQQGYNSVIVSVDDPRWQHCYPYRYQLYIRRR
jgi:hypothetical protein